MRKFHDWAAVQQLYDQAFRAEQCREHFGIAYSAWSMAIRRRRLRVKPAPRRRYEWATVQAFYNEGNSFYDCMRRFGFCRASWHKAVKRGEIRPRPLGPPLTELLANSNSNGRTNIKRRLIRAGLLENRCEECGLGDWLGERLTIQIDHINGVRDDYRLENLPMLCPNCHSQTGTYGRRSFKRGGIA
jgi:5-methylcytosine-specific restriction endonuclease McrA